MTAAPSRSVAQLSPPSSRHRLAATARDGLRRATLGAAAWALRGRGRATPAAFDRLLLLQLQNVGDSMIFSRTLQAVRARYPSATIDLLVNPVSAQLYSRCPLVDRLWVLPKGTRGGLPPREMLRELRGQRYDCVVADITQVSARYGMIAALVGAKASVGFDLAKGAPFFTQRLVVPDDASFVECNLLLARTLGADPSPFGERFYYSADDASYAGGLLARHGVGDRFVAIHPTSNWQSKTWFPERWAKVADALAERHALAVVFVGTTAEAPYVESIRELMTVRSVVLNGATDLPQLGAVLDRATLFVGTDSGPRHIAGALGRAQVTVMSSQDYAHRWGLDRPNEIVLRTDPECAGCMLSTCGHRRCMDLIDVQRVLDACGDVLARAPGAGRPATPDATTPSSV